MSKVKKRSKIGNFLFKTVSKAALYVAHHKPLFYILSYTWALPVTLGGWVIYLFTRIFLKKKITSKGQFFTARYLVVGKNWGGLEAGTTFLVADNMGKDLTLHTKAHELGHTYQNAVLGIFAVILIFIPAAIRYWCREWFGSKTPYDLWWGEGSGSYIGEELLTETSGKDMHLTVNYTDDFSRNPNYGKPLSKN